MFRRLAVLAVTLLFMGTGTAFAFDEVNTTLIGGIAVDGYDSTAYFKQSKPVEGQGEFTFDYKGAKWRFADARSRDLFAASPEDYTPQYGGYCSNQMSLGNIADIDPGVWLIYDGKLYLFGHKAGKERWEATGIAERIKDADKNWQVYLAKK